MTVKCLADGVTEEPWSGSSNTGPYGRYPCSSWACICCLVLQTMGYRALQDLYESTALNRGCLSWSCIGHAPNEHFMRCFVAVPVSVSSLESFQYFMWRTRRVACCEVASSPAAHPLVAWLDVVPSSIALASTIISFFFTSTTSWRLCTSNITQS